MKYDFKFKDYAPWVFRNLRESFKIDPADYMVTTFVWGHLAGTNNLCSPVSSLQISLTDKYILSELGSPGKSGSFFYYSRDYRFIIKTIHHTEHKFMRKILREYYNVSSYKILTDLRLGSSNFITLARSCESKYPTLSLLWAPPH